MSRAVLLKMFVMTSLAGCGTVMTDSCDWAEPIRPSVEDVLSDETARQILTHNVTGERLCGWRP